jgi:cell division protein FtsI (penicillin-binding protein 3)
MINFFGIQVLHHAFYTNLGKRQYETSITVYPPRGLICDRNGKPMTLNIESTSAFVLAKQLENKQALSSFLKKHFPEAFDRLQSTTQNFMYIKRKLSPEELELIEKANITDIKLIKEPMRFYPIDAAASIIGITDIDNNGLIGLEAQYNQRLAGMPSVYTIEKDARSQHCYFSKELVNAGTAGKPIRLTIDSHIQFLADELLQEHAKNLQAEEGGVVILDPTTGDVISLCHYPRFDPNDTKNLDISTTKNRTLTECYELGSVIKVFLALAALEAGVVTADEPIDCLGVKEGYIGGFKISTWKGHGILPFSEVIERSNNFGVVQVGLRLGPKLYDFYRADGFGSKTGINFPGEQCGTITPPEKWSKRSIVSLSFGYEIACSLLQLARAMSVISNDGHLVTPRLLLDPEQPIKKSERIYSTQTIQTIRSILEKTVQEGTARKAKIQGYTIMGKTGTADLIVDGKYCKTKNIYTFSGIVEKGNYKRIIITNIKNTPQHTLLAASIAAPLFARITEKMLIHDTIL